MNVTNDRLSVHFLGLDLGSPCIVASSVLTGDMERLGLAQRFGAGAVSTKMALPFAPPVSKPNMIMRSRTGGIVCPGDKRLIVDDAVELVKRAKSETDLVVLSNLLAPADDLEAWQQLALALQEAGADALELDISCPNVPSSVRSAPSMPLGTCVAQSPEASERVTGAVKSVAKVPVLCKLTGQVTNIVEVARACQRGGADGVVAINGLRAAPPIDIWNGGRPKYTALEKHNLGTLTGAPIFPIACRMVAEIVRDVDIPVIGCGGVSTWQDVVEMMMWGAQAVELCTAICVNGFEVLERINRGIEKFMLEAGYHSTGEFIGAAQAYLAPADRLVYRQFQLSVDRDKCNLCKLCLAPGACVAITLTDGAIDLDNDKCVNCGLCVQICPKHAIEIEYVV
ncbi:MAG: 4Fe-4S binding protein [Chloroflexi bacterium]|nr:4Fe-4S binding protein [Chloroflexota bacterium]